MPREAQANFFMSKELLSALVMTALILVFYIPLRDLHGEAALTPSFLIILMTLVNAGQYVTAVLQFCKGNANKITFKGYPMLRVVILSSMTLLYIITLEWIGFYTGSFIYFLAGSLIAQPDHITLKQVAIRTAVVFACIGFLYCLFTVALSVSIPKGFLGF